MSYKETHAAIEEAKTPKDLPEVDTSSVDSMMLSMGDGNRQHFKRSLLSVGKVLLAICIGLCICWLLSGCSPKIVEVEKPVIVEQTHTQHHTDIVRDTLVWRDSVYHFVKGDTVIIEKWHHSLEVRKMVVADTVRDTIPKVVTVAETRIVEKNVLRWWQKLLCWAGGLALACSAIFVAVRLRKGK